MVAIRIVDGTRVGTMTSGCKIGPISSAGTNIHDLQVQIFCREFGTVANPNEVSRRET